MSTADIQQAQAFFNVLGVLAICGVVRAYIASKKNQNAAHGFVAGFLLGPLAVLIGILSPRLPPPPPRKICESCRHRCPHDATTCWFCGDTFTLPEQNVPAEKPEELLVP